MPAHFSPTPTRRGAARRLVIAALALGAAAGLHAQTAGTYPDRPIRFVVPQPAGGTGDVVVRAVSQRLSERLGQPIVVENKPGAGGSVGAALAAKAQPDGYTLVLASPSFSTFTAMYKGLSFNPSTDLTPIGMMATLPVLIVTRAEAPYRTLAELIEAAKKTAEKVSFSSAGSGSLSHLLGTWFGSATGLKLLHVPFAGTAPSLTAVVGGQVDINFDPMAGAQLLKAGKIRALASAGAQRSELAPEVPTLAELGIPVKGSVWLGVMGPAGMPRTVVERLSRELEATMKEPELRAKLLASGVQADPMSAAEFARFFQADTAALTKIVRANNVRVD